MYSPGDYVNVFLKGTGKVLEADDGSYRVLFQTGPETIPESEATLISRELAEFLKNEEYRPYFDRGTLSRGFAYYQEDRVTSVTVMGKSISGIVQGTEDYSVSITYSKNAVRSRCSCPVGSMCKHTVSVLKYLSEVLKDLEEAPAGVKERKEETKTERLDFASRSITDAVLCYGPSFLAMKDFSEMLDGKDSSFYEALYNYIRDDKKTDISRYTEAKYIIAFSDEKFAALSRVPARVRNSSFYSDIERVRNYNHAFLMLAENDDRITQYSLKSTEPYFITNKQYGRYARYLFRSDSRRGELSLHLQKVLPFVENKEEVLSDYVEYARKNGDIPGVTQVLMPFIPEDKKISFFMENKNIHAPSQILKTMSPSLVMQMLSEREMTEDEADLIMNRYFVFAAADETMATSLLFLAGYKYRNLRTDVTSMLSDIPDATWLCDFLKGKCRKSVDYGRDVLYKYMTPNFSISAYKDMFTADYGIKIGDEYIHISCVDNNGIMHEILDGRLQPLSEALVERMNKMPEVTHQIEAARKELYERTLKEKIEEYSNAIDTFFTDEVEESFTFDENHKIHLEIHVSETDFYYEGYSVSARVGNEKMYAVKNLVEFLDAVKNEETIHYGKALEFNHRMENFDEEAIRFISFFLKSSYHEFRSSYNHKDIIIPYYLFYSMIEELKGEKIYFNEKETLLRLNSFKPEVFISEDYHLRTNLGTGEVLPGSSSYIYFPDQSAIDFIDADSAELRLLSFAIKNPSMDVSVVKEKFMNQVFSRYSSRLKVADSLKEEFKVSEVTIHASFDFNNPYVTVAVSYFKDDMEVSLADLTSYSDKAKATGFLHYLEQMGFVNGRMEDEMSVYNFFMMDFAPLKEMAEIYLSSSITSKMIVHLGTPQVKIQYNNSMMQMFLEESEYSEEELYQIYSAIKRKKKYVLLKNDRIVDLDNQEALDLFDTVEDMDMDPHKLLTVQDAPVYQSFKAMAHERNVSMDSFMQEMIHEISVFKESGVSIPLVNATLRDYQKDGFRWMEILSKYHLGGILADDMGLGKTLEVITLLKGDRMSKPSLIVCPKSLIFNWVSEFEKFDPDTKIRKIYGGAMDRKGIIDAINPTEKVIYITGYDSLRNDITEYEKHEFAYMILDEAQAIKNVHAQKSQSVKNIHALNRFALTGTPIENSVLDLWSIFDFLMPGYFPEVTTFKKRYENDEGYSLGIAKKCAPFILRRTKEEVLKDLPSKFERIVSAEMTPQQRKIYDAHIADAKRKMDSGSGAFEILPYLLRLRQICVSPSLFMENFTGESGKIQQLQEILQDYIPQGHRILLFSSFVSALKIVEEQLLDQKTEYLVLTGDTSPEERHRLVNLFNNNDRYKVFLISLKAGGTGLNLVGADTVIHLDPWWNVSAENQATDRAYRIGQKRNVEVIKLVCDDSVEQKVIELQNLKKDIIDKIISKDDSSVTGITLEDMKFILEG